MASLRAGWGRRAGATHRPGIVAAFALLVLAACAPRTAESPSPAPAPAPAAAPAVPPLGPSAPPLRVGGQRILVLPVQATSGLPAEAQQRVGAEILFALGERESRVTWISPEELERALRRSPGFAGDPRNLPADPLMHHRERRAVEPLIGELRRYAALTDARLALLPRSVAFLRHAGADMGRVRLSAALIDTRSGDLVWWGEAEGDPAAVADTRALASAAAALAARMLVPATP
ncbi:MAG TPA: hypothetical protein VHG28_15880 [Longimicrobiaceae bacterium]|nr:hypothetical protein [Longimicrobiaceae bacterium]